MVQHFGERAAGGGEAAVLEEAARFAAVQVNPEKLGAAIAAECRGQ